MIQLHCYYILCVGVGSRYPTFADTGEDGLPLTTTVWSVHANWDSISRPTKEFHIYSPCGQEGFRPPVRPRQIVLIDQMIHIDRLEVHSLFLFFYSTICASIAWVGWWVCPLTQFIFSSFFLNLFLSEFVSL